MRIDVLKHDVDSSWCEILFSFEIDVEFGCTKYFLSSLQKQLIKTAAEAMVDGYVLGVRHPKCTVEVERWDGTEDDTYSSISTEVREISDESLKFLYEVCDAYFIEEVETTDTCFYDFRY